MLESLKIQYAEKVFTKLRQDFTDDLKQIERHGNIKTAMNHFGIENQKMRGLVLDEVSSKIGFMRLRRNNT